ncbi:MAG: disulfide bond formation protein B [Methylophilaceae bacterium]|nr:disulfide bond formation protein B [Methylophilaceae bacterium]
MLNKLLKGRNGYWLGFITSFGLIAAGLVIQQTYHLDPCPLCISQRMAFMALGTLFLIAAIHNPAQRGRQIYGLLHFIAASVGAGIAARHVWIQSHPDQVMAECGVGFDYMFESFPFKRAIELVFKGTGECTKVDWTFLSFTIPQLSFVCFVALAIFAVLLTLRKKA